MEGIYQFEHRENSMEKEMLKTLSFSFLASPLPTYTRIQQLSSSPTAELRFPSLHAAPPGIRALCTLTKILADEKQYLVPPNHATVMTTHGAKPRNWEACSTVAVLPCSPEPRA